MNRSHALGLTALAVATAALTGLSPAATAVSISAAPPAVTDTSTTPPASVSLAADAVMAISVPAAPAAAPAHAAPTIVPTGSAATADTSSAPAAAAPAATTTDASRTAYINAMYASVVPASQRADLAGHYVLGYNLAGLSCGTGCTGLFNGQARSSFDDTFFSESLAYQRSRIAHEAAHAYGFLFISDYANPSWAGVGGWQTQFNTLDRSFVKTYDAEAFAACVAWQETGFNNRVDQISSVCTAPAAALAMAQIR